MCVCFLHATSFYMTYDHPFSTITLSFFSPSLFYNSTVSLNRGDLRIYKFVAKPAHPPLLSIPLSLSDRSTFSSERRITYGTKENRVSLHFVNILAEFSIFGNIVSPRSRPTTRRVMTTSQSVRVVIFWEPVRRKGSGRGQTDN